jgi:hypothetical protein
MKKIDIAKALGITYRALYNYDRFRRKPRLEIAEKIVLLTKGKVSYSDLTR